jgi:uncharacterized protein YndB with AHSA1/START domain
MKNTLTTHVSVTINAQAMVVYKAITTPATIKKYLMGTTVTSDWKEGSPIGYTGEYNGKTYHDKGVIKKMVPENIFQTTYWSSMSGKEDIPENYNLVTYSLHAEKDKTEVTLIQDNIADEKEQAHVTENWKAVLNKLKEVVENE